MAYKGRFKPKNPDKYRGDPTRIIYRSSWELRFFRFADLHPDIVWWQSEELTIPYVSPKDNKVHRYYPDVIFEKKVAEDKYETWMVEIKPDSQTRPPDPSRRNNTPTGRVSRRFVNEAVTHGVNSAKWEAARKYCDARGWKFQVMTEKHLGIK